MTTDDNPAVFGKLGLPKTSIGMHQEAHTLREAGTAGCLIQVKAQCATTVRLKWTSMKGADHETKRRLC